MRNSKKLYLKSIGHDFTKKYLKPITNNILSHASK